MITIYKREGEYAVINFDFSYLDTAFINGSVITVDAKDTIAEAVGVKGNKIVFVGSSAEIQELTDEKTKVIDLQGRSLLPGFNDTHFHLTLSGLRGPELDAAQVQQGPEQCASWPELLQLIRSIAARKKPGQWISLAGYESFWDTERPDLEALDEAAGDHPLHCMHGGGHICLYNHKALEYLGIYGPEDAARYPSCDIEIRNGKLTGLLRGNTHVLCMTYIDYTESQQREAVLKSQKLCLQKGITSVGDMGGYGPSFYHTLQKLSRTRTLRLRVNLALNNLLGKDLCIVEHQHLHSLGLMSGLGDEHFRLGPCKIMIDGGSSVPSCATREPYSHNPSLPRERSWEREEVWKHIQKIHEADCQASAHAIGDEAVEFMVEAYERCCAKDSEKVRAMRHRIEHCTVMDQDLIDRMAVLGLCPSVNAALIRTHGANYARFFGPERNQYLAPLRSMLDAGIHCSVHSDMPSGPCGLECIDGAVNRYDRTQNIQCDRTQSVSVMEAIRCYTLNAAYSSFEEHIKGSIEVGKLADLIVLSDNILEIDPMDIPTLQVDMTMIDGNVEYER